MKVISVIPLKKGVLKDDLTYFSKEDIPAGFIVSVPVRKQNSLALVVSSMDLKENKGGIKDMDFNLRKVSENLGESAFRKEYLDSVFSLSDYFSARKSSVIASLVPGAFIENYDKLAKITNKTGSGKTNRQNGTSTAIKEKIRPEKLLFQYPFAERISVYKTLIRESFARGNSIFLVLPTESDISKFEKHLSKGIEQFTFSFHGKLSGKKQLLAYEKIVSSPHPVFIMGTASFLSIPVNNIGTIILEHESSSAYKTIRRPYLDLRVVSELYASKIGAKFILADELLRYETIARTDIDGLSSLHPLSFRVDFEGAIEVPKNEKKATGKFQILKDKSLEEIKKALDEKKNVFIFSLRKGLATQTLCRDCGETLSCSRCESPLVLHLSNGGKNRMFVCNRCEREIDGETICSYCGSWNLMPLGIGTDTVLEEVERIFPKAKTYRLDKESVKNGREAGQIVKNFEEDKGAILVGTEMAFFYLTKRVPVSVVASFDSLWSIPNFRMSERIVHLILSMIENTSEKLIIQTKKADDEIISSIRLGNLTHLVRQELEVRQKLGYPPYKRFIKITFAGDKEETKRVREYLTETFREYSPEIFSGFASKQKGHYITNTLLRLNASNWSLAGISSGFIDGSLLQKLFSLPLSFEIRVDPEDLL